MAGLTVAEQQELNQIIQMSGGQPAAPQQQPIQVATTPQQQQQLMPPQAPTGDVGIVTDQGNLTPEESLELNEIMKSAGQVKEAKKLKTKEENEAEQEAIDKKFLETHGDNNEATIGLWDRLRFHVEPIKSNRLKLMESKYGAQNIIKGPGGSIWLNQAGEVRPLNAPGMSMADIGDIAGALPEMLGAVAAGLVGTVATGGAGGLPAAFAGGAAGSIIRQGFSASLGTPQVATPAERAVETGLSGVFKLFQIKRKA